MKKGPNLASEDICNKISVTSPTLGLSMEPCHFVGLGQYHCNKRNFLPKEFPPTCQVLKNNLCFKTCRALFS